MKKLNAEFIGIFAAVLSVGFCRCACGQTYTLTDLGTLGGHTSSARSINAAGEIVGESETPTGSTHAFLYISGRMTDLGTLGGEFSDALGINSSGEIVGF